LSITQELLHDERAKLRQLRDDMTAEGQRFDAAMVELCKALQRTTTALDKSDVTEAAQTLSETADHVCDCLQAGQRMRGHIAAHFILIECEERV
jgi:uncharacterized membrane protein YccC